jgi:hypothetical protein
MAPAATDRPLVRASMFCVAHVVLRAVLGIDFSQRRRALQRYPGFVPKLALAAVRHSVNRNAAFEAIARTAFRLPALSFHSCKFFVVFVGHCRDLRTDRGRQQAIGETPTLVRSADQPVHAKLE